MHTQRDQRALAQLPKLEDTLRRYLDSASVMVSPEAFARTREIVATFGAGEGASLHSELATLRDTVWKNTSYISEMWCVALTLCALRCTCRDEHCAFVVASR
jgi:hypothetical protein